MFLGHSVARQQNVSERTADEIDSEIRSIVDERYSRAMGILTENLDQLHTLAAALLEHETLSGDEIHDILDGKPIVREEDTEASQPPPTRKGASVPTTEEDRDRDEPGGAEPEPQPGS